MAIEYLLTDADTLQGLAVRYNVPWRTLADYNSLEYPYTLTSVEAYSKLYASGYITVKRALFTSALTFYKGSTFTSEVDAQGIQRIYELAEDTTISAGVDTGYLFVRSTVFGSFGNCIPGAISLPGKLNTSLGESVSSLTIANEQSFVNGTDATVRVTGQTIFIPTAGDASEVFIINNVANYLALLGGEDLALSVDGDLMDDEHGDLASMVGLDNIKQSVTHRLTTRRGSITQHPTYGSRFHELIGKTQSPYLRKLLELDVHETLLFDDRIESVYVQALTVQGTTVYVDLVVTITKQGGNFKLKLDVRAA